MKSINDKIVKLRKKSFCTFSANSDIPNEFIKLSNGEMFYLFDNGVENENRVAAFGNTFLLTEFRTENTFFIDGTFKVVPKPFEQLLIIQGVFKEKKYPLIFFSNEKAKRDFL